MESLGAKVRDMTRWLVVAGVALAFGQDLIKAIPHAIAALPLTWREVFFADPGRMAGSLAPMTTTRVDLLGPISITLLGAAGVAWSATQLWAMLRPRPRRYPGLEDRLGALSDLMTSRIEPPPHSLKVHRRWNANAKGFIELREGLRRAWTHALPAFSELAVVLNRMDAIVHRLGRNDRAIDLRQVAWLRENGNCRIAELRAALNCVLDILGRDQPTFAAPLPDVRDEQRQIAL